MPDTPLISGGEGAIYAVIDDSGVVAKVYRADVVGQELKDKICAMLENSPRQEAFTQLAWPIDILNDEQERFCGFIMNKLDSTCRLSDIYIHYMILKG